MSQNSHQKRVRRQVRRGTITVLAATFSLVALGLVAFAVDVGYMLASKQELQRTADAAALAACWKFAESSAYGSSQSDAMAAGRQAASTYALSNRVSSIQPAINQNAANASTGDLVFGRIEDLYSYGAPLNTSGSGQYNAVKLKVRRDSTLNGETPFFFAKIFHRTSMGLDAEATAGFARRISGVKTPSSGGNVDILPYALDLETWNALLAGSASDDWRWNEDTKTITEGSDGILEVNLFPQGTGSPGNRGTVDIGSSGNSTSDIARQIVYGISPADLAHHGGELDLSDSGTLVLNGDTGISAGVKDELNSIKGQPRLIPIFSVVNGPGNNAEYTIVHWAGIRIMEVKLTGSMNQKRVIVQPAPMVVPGGVATNESKSDYAYTPIVLVK